MAIWVGGIIIVVFFGHRGWVRANDNDPVAQMVKQMSIEEKIGQMILVEKNSIQTKDIARKHIGAILSGGGGNPADNSPKGWRRMIAEFQANALNTAQQIPILYGVDAVHGTANVRGAVVFPHNIGLGATGDVSLVERVAMITAEEMKATGQNWNFAPMLSIPTDLRWGRVFESYSEDPEQVSRMGAATVRGLVKGRILATPKHFIGEGLETWGSSRPYKLDQGDIALSKKHILDRDLPAFRAAIDAGAMSIMVSRSSIGNKKIIANHDLLTTVLKEEMGFQGFLVSDWAGVDLLSGDIYENVIAAVNAGVDMIMVPGDYDKLTNNLVYAIQNKDITVERIDDAVTRILRAKQSIGLIGPSPAIADVPLQVVGSSEHRAVAREAVRKSLVLLKNDAVLPIPPRSTLLVVGRGADDIGLQCGGWTIDWQGSSGAITDGTTMLNGLQKKFLDHVIQYYPEATSREEPQADIGIVVIAEQPYAEGVGDTETLVPSATDYRNIEFAKHNSKKVIVIVLTGRPLQMSDIVPGVQGLVVAWLPGSEGDGIAEVLSGDYNFQGRLPFSWPDGANDLLFPFHFGLEYSQN